MKNVFTLTKTLALAVLVFAFTGASAANPDGDKDTTKCKKHCCKRKDTDKDADAAMKELNAAMKDLTVQIKAFDGTAIKTQAPVKARNVNRIIIVCTAAADEQEINKQKIDFNNITREMDQVQEDMSRMDPTLKNDEAKNRKAADVILKTGMKL
jgi:hypothetical protein